MMTLYDLREMFIDDSQMIRIYDIAKEDNIYEGEFRDIPDEYEDYEISSIDSVYPTINFDGYITINIDTED